MTTEKMVDKIVACLMEDRQAAGTAEFWEENMSAKSEEIFSRIWADPEVQSEEEKDDVKKIVELTLTMMDADYTANANYTEWGVWEENESGEIFSAYEKDLRWTLVASFDGVRFNVRELDEKFQDEDIAFCTIWDEYMMYWGDNAAEGYAKKVEDYFCDDEY